MQQSALPKKPEPVQTIRWDVYKVAVKSVWLGTVEAPDKQTAIEKGAHEFKAETWRLYAVQRR